MTRHGQGRSIALRVSTPFALRMIRGGCFSFVLLLWINLSRASDDPLAYFKELSVSRPTNFVVAFTVQHTLLFNGKQTALAISVQDNKLKTVELPKPAEFHLEFIRSGDNFAVVRSGLPLEMGFQREAQFYGRGMLSNVTWSLIPSCQIQYHVDQTNTALALEDTLSRFDDLNDVLSLGISRGGPLSWSGMTFKGEARRELFRPTKDLPTAEIAGELAVSNGLPASATYHRVNSDNTTMVRYSYARRFEVPFPSEIRIERITAINKTNRAGGLTLYRISEVRRTVGTAGEGAFDPHFYLQKGNAFAATATPEIEAAAHNAIVALTGEPVNGTVIGSNSASEYLISNGVPIASMRNGRVQYNLAPPAQRSATGVRSETNSTAPVAGSRP